MSVSLIEGRPAHRCVCIACRKEMRNYIAEGLQPNDGLAFSTGGHYGSTVFDPMDGSHLEICVCDECLCKAAADGIVFVRVMQQLAKFKIKTWNGENPAAGFVEVEKIG